jgi:hypothetical protein
MTKGSKGLEAGLALRFAFFCTEILHADRDLRARAGGEKHKEKQKQKQIHHTPHTSYISTSTPHCV